MNCTGFAFRFEHRKWNRGCNGLHQLGQPVAPSILFPVFKSEGEPGMYTDAVGRDILSDYIPRASTHVLIRAKGQKKKVRWFFSNRYKIHLTKPKYSLDMQAA